MKNIMKCMWCMCKEDFEINGVLVGIKGDELKVTDAISEKEEDVRGYCDIKNLTINGVYWANWSEVEGNGALTNVLWLDEFVSN